MERKYKQWVGKMALIYEDLEKKLRCEYEVEMLAKHHCGANDNACPYYNPSVETRTKGEGQLRGGIPLPPYMKGCNLYLQRVKESYKPK